MKAEFCFSAQLIREGLALALAVAEKPILFAFAPHHLRAVIVYDSATVLSWERPLQQSDVPAVGFVFPVHIARIVESGVLGEVESLCFEVEGRQVRLVLDEADMPAELNWRWQPAALGAPPQMDQMMLPPQEPLAVPVDVLKGAVDRAMAAVSPPDETPDIRNSLVAVRAMARTINIGGQDLVREQTLAAHFDPACMAQALALVERQVEAQQLAVAVGDVNREVGLLTFAGMRAGWRVQCTIKSVMVEDLASGERRVDETAVTPAPPTALDEAEPEAMPADFPPLPEVEGAAEPPPLGEDIAEEPGAGGDEFLARGDADLLAAPGETVSAEPDTPMTEEGETAPEAPEAPVEREDDAELPSFDDWPDAPEEVEPDLDHWTPVEPRDRDERPARYDVPLD